MEKKFMKAAIREAVKAARKDEVPIGAVIVMDGRIIARGHNTRHKTKNAVNHAEIIAIQKACKKVGDWRLSGCDLYVTLEPCPMCAGACVNARVDNVYFGAYDQKAGCAGTLMNIPADERFNHRCGVTGGIMEEECVSLLGEFFRNKRESAKREK